MPLSVLPFPTPPLHAQLILYKEDDPIAFSFKNVLWDSLQLSVKKYMHQILYRLQNIPLLE